MARDGSVFRGDLEDLISRHNKENGSDTPDFILAGFLESCLAAFDATVIAREQWMGRPVGNGRALEFNRTVRQLMTREAVGPAPEQGAAHDVQPKPLDRHNIDPTVPVIYGLG